MRAVPPSEILPLIRVALTEDLPHGDVTTNALFPSALPAQAVIRAKQRMTVAGVAVARMVFREVDARLTIRSAVRDGSSLRAGAIVMIIRGDARSLLKAERVALNFLQRMSGIATLTARFVAAVRGTRAKILDTRKTAPGLRIFDKWAVRLGGGTNHRCSLSDGILIKDNHLALLQDHTIDAGLACRRARQRSARRLRITVEAESLDQVRAARFGRPDVILLDNMSPARVQAAVAIINGQALVEVSGGMTLAKARRMAAAGADFISVGSLTHSVPAADLSMDVTPLRSYPRRRRRRAG